MLTGGGHQRVRVSGVRSTRHPSVGPKKDWQESHCGGEGFPLAPVPRVARIPLQPLRCLCSCAECTWDKLVVIVVFGIARRAVHPEVDEPGGPDGPGTIVTIELRPDRLFLQCETAPSDSD